MRLSGTNPKSLAAELRVSYQAVMKVIVGSTKMLKADHNVMAARVMGVDSEWLATGAGTTLDARAWPFSRELLQACRDADPQSLRRAENAARVALDLDHLPR